jgi:DNA repair exonuclease SbcCD ATPase subunit
MFDVDHARKIAVKGGDEQARMILIDACAEIGRLKAELSDTTNRYAKAVTKLAEKERFWQEQCDGREKALQNVEAKLEHMASMEKNIVFLNGKLLEAEAKLKEHHEAAKKLQAFLAVACALWGFTFEIPAEQRLIEALEALEGQ